MFKAFWSDYRGLLRSWAAYGAAPAASLITAPVLARALGPDGRGQLSALLQPMTVAGAIAAIGVPAAVTFFIGRGFDHRSTIARAQSLSAVTTLCVALGLVLYSSAISESSHLPRALVLLIWAAFLPSAAIGIQRAALIGRRLYTLIDLERMLAAGLRVAAVGALFLASVTSAVAYAGGYMVAGLIASVFLYVGRDTRARATALHISTPSLLTFAASAGFGTIAAALNSRLDQAIMPAAVRPAELGYYSAAVAVAEIPIIIALVNNRNIFSDASRGESSGRLAYTALLGAIPQAILIAVLALTSDYAVPFVFGGEFSGSILITKILLCSSLIGYWADTASALLSGKGRPGLGSLGPAAAAVGTATMFWWFWESMSAFLAAEIAVVSQAASACVGFGTILFLRLRANTRYSRARTV